MPEFRMFGCLLLLLSSVLATALAKRPHIVFIMVDDMGWNDVSFHGSDQIQTPNIDSLAYSGVRLQEYYSEAVCTPARSALLTGKYPSKLGMQGTPLYNSEDRGIPLTERLLPSYLKEIGYSTHLVGKWHVGMSRDQFLPTKRGYDTHYGMRGGYVDYYTYDKVEKWPSGRQMFGLDFFDGQEPQDREQRYIVDALTDRAINVIQNHNASTPLFLHVTHNAPHAGNDGGALQPPLFAAVRNKHIANSDRRLYAEVVTYLDQTIGHIVKALNDKQILDDTIIVFASDNGAPAVGFLRNWGNNLPFRGKKSTPWEGGVRVPAFIWHPKLQPTVWKGLMHITDWLPTLAAAAGAEINDKELDGINQWHAIVNSAPSNRREVLIALEDGERNQYAAYRAGDYKIVMGNVEGISNGYYGRELMANKKSTPDYYQAISTCDVMRILQDKGLYTSNTTVLKAARRASTIIQQDTVKDSELCLPTKHRGCLFNIRRDPQESHDLWERAGSLAKVMLGRLQSQWSLRTLRPQLDLEEAADPANFGYTWVPWVADLEDEGDSHLTMTEELPAAEVQRRTESPCQGTAGVQQFLCLLRRVF